MGGCRAFMSPDRSKSLLPLTPWPDLAQCCLLLSYLPTVMNSEAGDNEVSIFYENTQAMLFKPS